MSDKFDFVCLSVSDHNDENSVIVASAHDPETFEMDTATMIEQAKLIAGLRLQFGNDGVVNVKQFFRPADGGQLWADEVFRFELKGGDK